MIRALIVGGITAITTAMLGNFTVASRQSVVSDMLAHTALAGVGIGIFWQVSPTISAVGVTLVSALLLWWLSRKDRSAHEAISMLLLSGGLALALLLVHLDKNNPVAFENYLFGSILTVTSVEMYGFIGINLVIMGGLLIFWKSFLTLVFDSQFLQTQTKRVYFELSLMFMIAFMVGIGLKIIGGLLIGALLVIPVLIAQEFSKSFAQNVRYSIFFNILAVIVGIITSFYLDVPTSSAIVLSLIGFYFISKIILIVGTKLKV